MPAAVEKTVRSTGGQVDGNLVLFTLRNILNDRPRPTVYQSDKWV